MIKDKHELKYYLTCDKIAMSRTGKPKLGDSIWKFLIALRKHEYYRNCKDKNLLAIYWHVKFKLLSEKLGFSIPINVCGPGLALMHYGNIIISDHAKIGCNCKIHVGVNIGTSAGKQGYPQIGNNVYIGPGAKIIGGVRIADNSVIGANACVVKNCEPSGNTWGGVPARLISQNDSSIHLIKATEIYTYAKK